MDVGTDNQLVEEIGKAQQSVATDQYPMSIGELASMYRDNEIVLNPKFQRYYRWSVSQKSALIESILIGIPVPPIFCYEREDSRWEIIDGLQRVSTILEFMGVLGNGAPEASTSGTPRKRLILSKTQYLPSLKGACWEADGDGDESGKPIPASVQIAFKRSKIGIQIIKKTSAPTTKFDLFQRLNSNGSPLTPQEYRSCVLVMINEAAFESLRDFAQDTDFRTVLRLDNDDAEQQDDVDYACRLLTHCFFDEPGRDKDIDEIISESMKEIFLNRASEIQPFLAQARAAVAALSQTFGDSALRRFAAGCAKGIAGKVGFETVMVGVVANWASIAILADVPAFLRERVPAMWEDPKVEGFFSRGLRSPNRIRMTVPFGKAWFRP